MSIRSYSGRNRLAAALIWVIKSQGRYEFAWLVEHVFKGLIAQVRPVEETMPIRFTPNVFTSGYFQPGSGARPTLAGGTWDILAPVYAHFGPIVGLDAWLGR